MIYDVIILGAGPAGLAAALYSSRAMMSTLVIEKGVTGGQIALTSEVDNYPGAPAESTGPSLVERMKEQAVSFGAEFVLDEITSVELDGLEKVVRSAGKEYRSKTVILATGAKPKRLECPGEDEFTGRGVAYCATCDGAFFTDMRIFVIGGGDTAVDEALFLSKIARQVTIVHRRDELRAAKSIQEKAFHNPKIDFIWDSVVEEIKGEGVVGSIVLKNVKTGETTEIVADPEDGTFGIFVLVGYDPATELFNGVIAMEKGYIMTDNDMKTSVPGVFAAGDLRVKSLRQVVTATSDGAIAAVQAEKYIEAL